MYLGKSQQAKIVMLTFGWTRILGHCWERIESAIMLLAWGRAASFGSSRQMSYYYGVLLILLKVMGFTDMVQIKVKG